MSLQDLAADISDDIRKWERTIEDLRNSLDHMRRLEQMQPEDIGGLRFAVVIRLLEDLSEAAVNKRHEASHRARMFYFNYESMIAEEAREHVGEERFVYG